ncbi:MAG: hypothetical protein KatS3mg094_358 [Candidatus Parcubacteria bacterium]|nr:MAG: hypothetical protein KatS3mg094_358 [Candidatus Parcubacteria bacterium]
MKIRKSVLKRFKITKNGKFLRRKSGISHFLAKKSSKIIRRKKRLKKAKAEKNLIKYLNYNI